MSLKYRMPLAAIAVAAVLLGLAAGAGGQSHGNPLANLNLTEDQVDKLARVFAEFNSKQFEIVSGIKNRYLELILELKKEDRFETGPKDKDRESRAAPLVKGISLLYGQLLKTKVEYLLKARDVLTKEQKFQLISGLEFEVDIPKELSALPQGDILEMGLDLSRDQIRKILGLRTEGKIKALRLELEMSYRVLDLETELARDETDPQIFNQIILEITDLGTRLINDRVDQFLKMRDLLTATQKKKILHLLMMSADM